MKLLHGDCLDLMKEIPNDSIDMVLTDPPYGTTQCKWDSVIPFRPMWKQLKRITKDNTVICLFGSEPFSSHLRLSNLEMFKYDWVWIKNRSGGAVAKDKKPLSSFELISVFGGTNYYPQKTKRSDKELKKLSKKSICNNSKSNGVGFNKLYTQERNKLVMKYPRRDLYFKTVFNRSKEKVPHPTQKPIQLMEYLIKTYTLENEVVLDFTMGSGSTGVACKNLDRNFIGIEKDDYYFKIAKARIEGNDELVKQLKEARK